MHEEKSGKGIHVSMTFDSSLHYDMKQYSTKQK